MSLSSSIEALLFYYAEPLSIRRLGELLHRSVEEIVPALDELEVRLQESGIRLIRHNDAVTLGTAPDASALIESVVKEELSKDLSKSSVETLAIILYKGPLSRAEIDHIRGVNSTFILRNLQIRGLIERIDNPKDQRSFLYRPTFRLLESLGVTVLTDLPRYQETIETLSNFVAGGMSEEENAEPSPGSPSLPDNPPTPVPGSDTDESIPTEESESEERSADIADEDDAGEGFDDEDLRAHHSESLDGDGEEEEFGENWDEEEVDGEDRVVEEHNGV